MDVLGNLVDEEGMSYDKLGCKIGLKDYFINQQGVVNEDFQWEVEYISIFGEKIVECYYKDNIVFISYLVVFVVFEFLKY